MGQVSMEDPELSPCGGKVARWALPTPARFFSLSRRVSLPHDGGLRSHCSCTGDLSWRLVYMEGSLLLRGRSSSARLGKKKDGW